MIFSRFQTIPLTNQVVCRTMHILKNLPNWKWKRVRFFEFSERFAEAWNRILAGLNRAENVTVRTGYNPFLEYERGCSERKTRVISLFLLSVRWTFFFSLSLPENGNWKRGRGKIRFRDFVFDLTVRNQLDFMRNKFRVFGERGYVTTSIELKITSFRGGDFFWWCWFTSYEISFSPLFLRWLFDQRGRIILDTDPFVISFLYCVSEESGSRAEEELWRWNYVYIYI